MSGKEILVDTNIILHLLKGSSSLVNTLQGKELYISFVTELELLGYKGISAAHENEVKSFLNDCFIISMSNLVKEKYIEITRKHNLKLPDALIAASAIAFDMPFITEDKGFKKVTELELIFYQRTATLADPKKDTD